MLSCESLSIISQSFRFVNTFFKTFLNFFKVFSSSSIVRRSLLGGNFVIISHPQPFVNRFFKTFLIFLRKFFEVIFSFSLRSSRQLHYSTTFFPFCQYLFSNFFHFGHSFNFDNSYLPFLCISPFRLLNLRLFNENSGFWRTFAPEMRF